MAKRVIKQQKLDNATLKKENAELHAELNSLCRTLYDDLIRAPTINISIEESSQGDKRQSTDGDKAYLSKVSFNPDIEIASYDPKMPLAKPNQARPKPVAGNLVLKRPTMNKASAVSSPPDDQNNAFIIQQVKQLISKQRV